jgi:hypothetical protein
MPEANAMITLLTFFFLVQNVANSTKHFYKATNEIGTRFLNRVMEIWYIDFSSFEWFSLQPPLFLRGDLIHLFFVDPDPSQALLLWLEQVGSTGVGRQVEEGQ